MAEVGMRHDPRKVVGYIFRAWITRKDGTRDFARDHGFKAWRIPVYDTDVR